MYFEEKTIDLSIKRDFQAFQPLAEYLYVVYCDGDLYLYTGLKEKPINLRTVRYLRLDDSVDLFLSNAPLAGKICVLRFFKSPVIDVVKEYVISQHAFSLAGSGSIKILIPNSEIYEKIEVTSSGPVSVKFSKLDSVQITSHGTTLNGFNTYKSTIEAIGEYGGTYNGGDFAPFAKKVERVKLPAGVFQITNLDTSSVSVNVDLIIDRGGVSIE